MPNSSVRRAARPRLSLGPSQRLVGVFILFVLLPGAFLGVFALRVLRQEGQIARQRTREGLERTAAEIGRDLDSEFRSWEAAVRSAASLERPFDAAAFPETVGRAFTEPGGGVFLSLSGERRGVFPAEALSYVPRNLFPAQTAPGRTPAGLAEAESLELARKNYPAAVRAYRSLADSAGAESRTLILQRLARTLRKAGRLEEAAKAYEDLLRSDPVRIGGVPSDLIARAELLSLAFENDDQAASVQAALDFYREITTGTWLLDKPRYLYYSEAARTRCRDLGAGAGKFEKLVAEEERRLSLSGAAEDFLSDPEREIFGQEDAYFAFRSAGPLAVLLLSAEVLGTDWWPRLLAERGEGLEAVLYAADGSAILGSPPPDSPPFAVIRDLRIDDTPWRLQIWPGRPEAIRADIRQRQALFVGMLGFVTVLLVFGGYMTVRIVRRELEIARLRADFVSTVSHEFRSPLTGIRQLGGMLLDGRVAGQEKQRDYFRMIVQESDRLTRLVENVLDFSRMEEGRREYRFEPLDLSPWLQTLAADFAAEVGAHGAAVEAHIPDGLPALPADREALGSAVRNLLDNAVKYSPGAKTVWLDALAESGEVRISIRDEGVGITEHEQKRIFDRFYRADGEMSKRVKGAGLGLSLVLHIVKAHGGTVECRSRVGEGSAFTIRLPTAPVTGGG